MSEQFVRKMKEEYEKQVAETARVALKAVTSLIAQGYSFDEE